MDSMEIIKVIAVHGLSVNSPWTVKTEFGCVYCQNKICGIHGTSVESVESTWITWGSDKSSRHLLHQETATLLWLSLDALAVLEHPKAFWEVLGGLRMSQDS
jgi:hypothetical protein